MKKLLVLGAVLAITASSALALTGSKDGSIATLNPGVPNVPSAVRSDFEFNTGGAIDIAPTTGGTASGWGEFFVAPIQNTAGDAITIDELGFPCCGSETGEFGWLVWVGDMGGPVQPMGDAYTCDFHGSFTPVDPAPDTFPPTVYTYIAITGVDIAAGAWFVVGYDNTGTGGHVDYNGNESFAWYGGAWDPEVNYSRTEVHQVKGSTGGSPSATEVSTWGGIKNLF